MVWQSIETAPRNGSWILLSGGTIRYGWCGADQPGAVVGQSIDGRWQFAWYDSGFYGEYEDPTHWMPLQEPIARKESGL